LETCLQAVLDELHSITERVQDEDVKGGLAGVNALVGELLWRLQEGSNASAA